MLREHPPTPSSQAVGTNRPWRTPSVAVEGRTSHDCIQRVYKVKSHRTGRHQPAKQPDPQRSFRSEIPALWSRSESKRTSSGWLSGDGDGPGRSVSAFESVGEERPFADGTGLNDHIVNVPAFIEVKDRSGSDSTVTRERHGCQREKCRGRTDTAWILGRDSPEKPSCLGGLFPG